MESEQSLRKLSALQARVRGFLTRRHFRSLRAEYEATVREIEGDLSTVQWAEGCIPRPQFLPEVKFRHTWKAEERVSHPERSHFPCKEPKEVTLKKSEGSAADTGTVLCPEVRPQLPAEQTKKLREDSGDSTGVGSPGTYLSASASSPPALPLLGLGQHIVDEGRQRACKARTVPSIGPSRLASSFPPRAEATDPGLPCSRLELQHLHSHLAMELLWLQQAINSRKEYLILKQTLSSQEEDQRRDGLCVCPGHVGQACERAHTQPSPPLKGQSYRDRTTGKLDHGDDSCWRGKSQPHKSPDKTTTGAERRAWCHGKTGHQLSTPSDDQTMGDKFTKEPSLREQASRGPRLQLMNHLEDQMPRGLQPRGHCSEKARGQLLELSGDPGNKNTSPRGPECQKSGGQRAGPVASAFPKDHVIWDGTLAGAAHGGQDLCKTKPPKGQTSSDRTSTDGASSESSHKGWTNQRTVPWKSRSPEYLSATGEDHWRG
ncbi:IQ domain-containing protein C isoform X1 [Echinops telfairi]|uniref:IQ domain-containing protein C isoform X1 n=1 Tax=Echinops telfairi TaxID=9371 RepID=A0AC55DTY2_ECHTE|nr:IQ domain-containing protein C isoform X1 [Echinops telfairi]